jgi:signal peptidase I
MRDAPEYTRPTSRPTGKDTDKASYCGYHGPSMYPTLRESDLLEVVPYGVTAVRRGDVVVGTTPTNHQLVVHRVARVSPQGILLRGDNSISDDPYLVQTEDISGRVVAAWHGQKRRSIAGGLTGRLVGAVSRWWAILDRRVLRLLHSPYLALAWSGIVARLLPRRLRPHVVVFQVNGQDQLRLLLGRRVIGRYDARQRQWEIQRPFRLLLNEAALPGPQASEPAQRPTPAPA